MTEPEIKSVTVASVQRSLRLLVDDLRRLEGEAADWVGRNRCWHAREQVLVAADIMRDLDSYQRERGHGQAEESADGDHD